MNSTVIVNNDNTSEITVIVNTEGPSLDYINNTNNTINLFKNEINEKFNSFLILQNISGALIETINEVDTVQNYLSGKWNESSAVFQNISGALIETINEVDTVQNYLSSKWQESSNFLEIGIVDGGFF
jgi:hypothetical protein